MGLKLSMAGLGLALLVAVAPARGQFVQYAPPGDFRSPAEAREEVFELAMERARWRFGRLLVDPWIYLNNVAYQQNQVSGETGGTTSDLTVGMGAGINTYMTIGSDWIWGTFLLPEYTWWKDLDERRRLNGRYGTGLFGNLGRLGVELTAMRFDQSRIFSYEVEQQVSQRSDRGQLLLTYDLGKGFLLFGDARAESFSSLEDGVGLVVLGRLDRDETVVRGGIVFDSPRGIRLGVGIERSDVEFDSMDLDRSNSGESIVFDFTYEGSLFELRGQVASRSIEPEGSSEFVPFDDITGDVNLGWRPMGPARLELYARKDVAYSIQARVSYIEYETRGASIRFGLRSKGSLRVFGEDGEVRYQRVSIQDVGRIDDRTAYGGEFSLRFDRFTWSIGGSVVEYKSSLPGLDRDFTRFMTSIGLGGERSSPWG